MTKLEKAKRVVAALWRLDPEVEFGPVRAAEVRRRARLPMVVLDDQLQRAEVVLAQNEVFVSSGQSFCVCGRVVSECDGSRKGCRK